MTTSDGDLDNIFQLDSEQIPPESILLSIGRIITAHNRLETILLVFLSRYLGLSTVIVGSIFEAINNRARVDLIKRLADGHGHTRDELSALNYAMKCFDLCAEIRNTIAHSCYEGPSKKLPGKHVFIKSPTTAGSSWWYFAVTEEEMIGTADAVLKASSYVEFACWTVRNRQIDDTFPLPGKPPLPRKLSLFALREDQLDELAPPRSSPG